MKIDKLILRHTPRINLSTFDHNITHLDAEGSKTDFSSSLKGKPIEYLNIHGTPFRHYKHLLELRQLKTLIVSRGKLPPNIKQELSKTCKIIEK